MLLRAAMANKSEAVFEREPFAAVLATPELTFSCPFGSSNPLPHVLRSKLVKRESAMSSWVREDPAATGAGGIPTPTVYHRQSMPNV